MMNISVIVTMTIVQLDWKENKSRDSQMKVTDCRQKTFIFYCDSGLTCSAATLLTPAESVNNVENSLDSSVCGVKL